MRRPDTGWPRASVVALYATGSALALYDLVHVLGAYRARRWSRKESVLSAHQARRRLVALVPSHDAASEVATCVRSLNVAFSEAPNVDGSVLVIAHNCSDQTAQYAASAGAEVREVHDDGARGKAGAIVAGLEAIASVPYDAVMIVDADCKVSPNAVSEASRALAKGVRVAQLENRVANPSSSISSAFRYASFSVNTLLRPLGAYGLGASAQLTGTGMLFSAGLLGRVPFAAYSYAEDKEYWLRLVESGERIHFIFGAWVSSDSPETLRGGIEQQLRWETGNHQLRPLAWSLLRRSAITLDARLALAAADCLLPGQVPSAAVCVGATLGTMATRRRSGKAVSWAVAPSVVKFITVVCALRLAAAPRAVYQALPLLPLAAAGKAFISLRILLRRGSRSW